MPDEPDLYAYTDYRAYLREWFRARAGRPSQSGFAKRVPCSPALLSSILNDTRNLGRARAERFANVLKLDDDQRAYFLTLVTFAEGESPADRERAWARIRARRLWNETAQLDDAAYVVYSNWLIPALFEMRRWPDYQQDPDWIAARVRPQVSADDVREALAVMEKHGLVGGDAESTLAALGDRLSSGHDVRDPVRGHLLAEYHGATLDLVKRRLFETVRPSRHYVTVTFAADEGAVDEVKRQFRTVVEQATAASVACASPDRVMVLAVQLVPVAGDPDESELARRDQEE